MTGHATATLTIGGKPLTVATDGTNGNSADAVKTYVDANIQITPATANNPLNTTHVLTAHVNVNAGAGAGYVNAPAGTLITFSIVSGPGSFVGGVTTCTTVGTTGSCTATITSATPGTTVVKAATNVTVGGIVVHRETGDGKAGDSANAQKNWIPDVDITSVQKLKPNDAATVTPGDGTGPTPTGTVTFRLYPPSDTTCSGTASFTQTVTLDQRLRKHLQHELLHDDVRKVAMESLVQRRRERTSPRRVRAASSPSPSLTAEEGGRSDDTQFKAAPILRCGRRCGARGSAICSRPPAGGRREGSRGSPA